MGSSFFYFEAAISCLLCVPAFFSFSWQLPFPFSPSVPWPSPASPELLPGVRGIFELLHHLLSCLASFNSRATDLDVTLVPATSLCSRSILNGGGLFWWAGCSGGASLQALSASIRVLPSAGAEHLWGQQHGPVPLLSLLSLRLHFYDICFITRLIPQHHGIQLLDHSINPVLCPALLVMLSPSCPPPIYFWVTPPFPAAWVILEVPSLL